MNLYEEYQWLIAVMAKSYKRKWNGLDYDDLYQAASIALWQAQEKYDECKGEFQHYALKQMKGYLLKYMYTQNQLHTPKNIVDVATVIRRLQLENDDPSEIAEYISKNINDVHNALNHLKINAESNFQSLDAIDVRNEDSTTEDVIVSVNFQQFTNTLNTREKLLLDKYRELRSTIKVAACLNITQPQVSRLLNKIKHKYLSYSEGHQNVHAAQ